MPKLSDITKPHVPQDVWFIRPGNKYHWDGDSLWCYGVKQNLCSLILHDDRWGLPAESTAKELVTGAGFKIYESEVFIGYDPICDEILVPHNATTDQVKKVIAFAKEIKECKQ